MQNYSHIRSVNRIIDANINRAKEGLRVCEEITRFILNNKTLTAGFKKVRHALETAARQLGAKQELVKDRDSAKDIGKRIYADELNRKGIPDIFFANIQRIKESIRVLEEFSKLKNKSSSLKFKELRYRVYTIEKQAALKIASLASGKK